MKKYIASTLIIAFIAAVSIQIQTTDAQISFQWGTEETHNFNFTQEAGTITNHTLNLKNTSAQTTSIILYATDGTTTHRGSFTTKPRSVEQDNIGKWITTEESKITLEANETKTIAYTINIPEFTPPGTYSGGFSLENIKEDNAELEQTGVKTYSRIVNPISIKIPGEKEITYSWNKFYYSKQDSAFIFDLENNGNIQLKTEGKITFEGFPKQEDLELSQFSLIPKQNVNSKIKWQQRPTWGYFKATATLDIIDTETNEVIDTIKKSTSFIIIPTAFIILILILVLLTVGILSTKKFLQKKALANSSPHLVQEGETVTSIAQTHEVDWKKIVKINKLTPPYSLSAGQTIYIPNKKA